MGVVIFIAVVVFLFLIVCGIIKNVQDEEAANERKRKKNKLREATLLDSKHQIVWMNNIESMLRYMSQKELTQQEKNDFIGECEVWLSEDRKYLCVNPLGIKRKIAIKYDDITDISPLSTVVETEVPVFDCDKSKSGFDTGGAVLGGIIAGTPGAIIGGFHNMGKETKQEPKIISNLYSAYYLDYLDDNGGKHYFMLHNSQLDFWKKLLPDKWIG